MRSGKQCILGLDTDLGSGLPCGEQFTRGYFVHLIAALRVTRSLRGRS
ncbi:hypothetical protein BN2537_15537 [Streptomyces venezuelae]|nr:hypothetical protein BN2537_15537 [Streptomyces venezuelae]